LSVFDRLLERRRHLRAAQQKVGNGHQLGNAGEVLHGVHLHPLGEEERIDRIGRDVADQKRVAVGLRLRRQLDGDIAGGTGAVVDDDLLAERPAHLWLDHARDDVGRSAGRERDQHPDRAVGISLS
jgi:hypothetical protein